MFGSADTIIPDPFREASRSERSERRDNPQALNRYGYVLNNPLRYTESDGDVLLRGYVGTLHASPAATQAFPGSRSV
jgi:hypothetical protein